MAAHLLKRIDIEVVPPEAFEGGRVIGLEKSVILSEQQAGARELAAIDASRSFHDQALTVGHASGVHVAITDLAPVVHGTRFDSAHEFLDAQRVGSPVEMHRVLQGDGPDGGVGHEGVGALVVGVDDQAQWRRGRQAGRCRHRWIGRVGLAHGIRSYTPTWQP